MCNASVAQLQDQGKSDAAGGEIFVGTVKSYSTRRGFGFLACGETARRYGRDVYLSKLVAADIATEGKAEFSEGESVQFAIQLSPEGFPQAVSAVRLRRLSGKVTRVSTPGEGGVAASVRAEGGDDVVVPTASCGRLLLAVGDLVRLQAVAGPAGLEARLVELLETKRDAGEVLGCFSLELPRSVSGEGSRHEARAPAVFDGRAFCDRLMLRGLPGDLDTEEELAPFFLKLGATSVDLEPCGEGERGRSASVSFPGLTDVARFLTQVSHTHSMHHATCVAPLRPCSSGACGLCRGPMVAVPTPMRVVLSTKAPQSPADATKTKAPPVPLELGVIPDHAHAVDGQEPPTYSPPTPLAAPDGAITQASSACWFCPHGFVIPPPMAPELEVAGGAEVATDCLNLQIRWPSVIHASEYVVQICELGAALADPVSCTVPSDAHAVLVELCARGLALGRPYAANVRCVAPCGCQSQESAWACLIPCSWDTSDGEWACAQQTSVPLAPECLQQTVISLPPAVSKLAALPDPPSTPPPVLEPVPEPLPAPTAPAQAPALTPRSVPGSAGTPPEGGESGYISPCGPCDRAEVTSPCEALMLC